MRVSAVEVIPYAPRFAAPYVTARGTLERREMALLRIVTDSGLEGLGEAVPLTLRGGASLTMVVAELREAGEGLVGTDIGEWGYGDLPGLGAGLSPPAAAALEVARLDLAGKLLDQPLWRLLGADRGAPVPCNATLSAGAPSAVAAEAERWAGLGFETFKLKVGAGEDVALLLAAARTAVGPEARLRIDANGTWSTPDAIAHLAAIERYGIELAEQPAPTLEDLAQVRSRTTIPIVADESVASAEDARRAVELGACDRSTIKLAKVGGIGAARRIAGILPSYLSSALDGPVGIAAAAHLAQLLPDCGANTGPAHGLATQLLFDDTVASAECEVRGGLLHLPDDPGLGVEIDRRALERAALDR